MSTAQGARRPSRAGGIVTLLLVFSPVLVPAALVLGVGVAFLVLLVIDAFSEGFAVGCAALGAAIGFPSIGLLWLSAVLRTGGGRRAAHLPPPAPGVRSGLGEIEERYRTGDFLHRDSEAEKRVYDAEKRARNEEWAARREAHDLSPG